MVRFEENKRNISESEKKNKNLYRSDIDLPGDEAWNAPQLHVTAEELYQKIRQKEIET